MPLTTIGFFLSVSLARKLKAEETARDKGPASLASVPGSQGKLTT
jgi:hypothetical protein